jgi:hypothetical protein
MLVINFANQDVSVQQSRYEFMTNSFEFDGVSEIMIGSYKPIASLYLNISAQTLALSTSFKYFNGTSYSPVKGFKDLSFGLSRAGFISWERNQLNEKKSTEFGADKYWYKLQLTELNGDPLSSPVTVQFKGIDLVFSDDWDLIEEYPSIMQHIPDGQETFIRFHASARDEIITDLRNAGVVINGESYRKQLDQWDLLDKDEVNEASKFLTLSKIFNWLSDNSDDRYKQLASDYQADAGEALTPLISIDINDDGIESDVEQVDSSVIIVGRL